MISAMAQGVDIATLWYLQKFWYFFLEKLSQTAPTDQEALIIASQKITWNLMISAMAQGVDIATLWYLQKFWYFFLEKLSQTAPTDQEALIIASQLKIFQNK